MTEDNCQWLYMGILVVWLVYHEWEMAQIMKTARDADNKLEQKIDRKYKQ